MTHKTFDLNVAAFLMTKGAVIKNLNYQTKNRKIQIELSGNIDMEKEVENYYKNENNILTFATYQSNIKDRVFNEMRSNERK